MILTILVTVAGALLCLGVLASIVRAAGRAPASPRALRLTHDAVYLGSALACLVAAAATASFLIGEPFRPLAVTLPVGLPWLPARLRLDSLSAWFLLVIDVVGFAAAIYGQGYGHHVEEPSRVLPFFPAFLAAMNVVPLADDAFTFLLAWEFMSVSSWLLVLANHRQPDNARAGLIYLVMAVFGGACLLLAFGLLAGFDGAYAFADIRAHPPAGWAAAATLLLVVLGTGSKAGVVPLHAWLPIAHPAAPSHVSALMSGVMTKVALYGLIRVLFDLMGGPNSAWAAVLLALGAVSAIYGILSALLQDDLKTLLACSTIENVGIILIGLGLTGIFRANGLPALAAVSATAALLHVLNHAAMKSLMFFAAGAVQTATGTRSLERLGGLIHRLPATAALALIGAAAISALPPFNGFVSEWLTFQAILGSPQLTPWGFRFGIPVAGAVLALAAALAATCFVRAYGIVFLGRPRSLEAAQAREVDGWMRGAMAGLAALCAIVGVLPLIAILPLQRAVANLTGAALPDLTDGAASWLWLAPLPAGASSYSGVVVFLTALVVTGAVILGIHRLASHRVRRGPAWDCGFPDPTPATQYTGSSFAQPLRRVFGTLIYRAAERLDMPEPGEMRPAHFEVELTDPAWAGLYAPMVAAVNWIADRANPLQFMTIHRYLSFVFTALILLLSAVALSR